MLVRTERAVQEVELRPPQPGEVVWLHLVHPGAEELTHTLSHMFRCHPLAIEDALHFGQRPKVDHYAATDTNAEHAFISFYALRSGPVSQEFCAFIGDGFIVTVVRDEIPAIAGVYHDARNNPEVMDSPGRVLYHILDACVDQYFAVVEELENVVDNLQMTVIHHPGAQVTPDIFRLKRQLQRIRYLVADAIHVIELVSHEAFPYTAPQQVVYFADVRDHALRMVNEFDALRDHLNGLLDLQMAQRTHRMNDVMKTLTVLSTIFLPWNFIVGLYGMNFQNIPELHWRYGYAYVWGLMLATGAAFVYVFKRKGWW
ncbi:magnesium transport protein CorA [Alicyclobacillus cellulosilyticus]|uniref:Magnesium transport protein CorA n=1 Tax=Alicyclobacillus cellulosilyticus TaxID=1003997 RepID=A0A917K236_9BACL|nr:magnesium/cobalt transporter CorA [Alicyclobacillus cellulosilyticus]GGI95679.1 magnesium transport protein CorA [Alicyclobacillus cellulosilyticus]